jgi:hypothetical protein
MELKVGQTNCESYYGVIHETGDLRDAQDNMNSLGEGIKYNNVGKFQFMNVEKRGEYARIENDY